MRNKKRVAIVQSNYLPWRGYFELIASVDEFVFLDSVQYTKRDWRNRNKIKTPSGSAWLTVPVMVKGRYLQAIDEVRLAQEDWAVQHWRKLQANYRNAPFFLEISKWLKPLMLNGAHTHLAGLNQLLIREISSYLGIGTKFMDSRGLSLVGGRNKRLVSICKELRADEYLSGPAAKEYLNVEDFRCEGIEVKWFDYGEQGEYPQQWGGFIMNLSIVDLLFNCGPAAANNISSIRKW